MWTGCWLIDGDDRHQRRAKKTLLCLVVVVVLKDQQRLSCKGSSERRVCCVRALDQNAVDRVRLSSSLGFYYVRWICVMVAAAALSLAASQEPSRAPQ